jgi:thymidylate synthase (FAD)
VHIVEPSVTVEEINGVALLKKIERAGRTCYKSEAAITDRSYADFVRNLIHHGHLSVLEHACVTVRIICDRGTSHTIVRHRLGSYSQESTRYCNYASNKHGKEITCVPYLDGLTPTQIARRGILYKHLEEFYMTELAAGVPPQQARDNLPTCLKTEIVVTYNLREWLHFLTLRCHTTAHPQIRKVALMILATFAELIPVIFTDLHAEYCS